MTVPPLKWERFDQVTQLLQDSHEGPWEQEAVRDLSNQRGGVSWSPKSVLRSALKRHHLGHVISKVHIWGYKDWTQFQLPMKNLHLSIKKQNVPKMGTASPYRGSLRGGLGEVHCGQRRWHKMMSKQLAKAYISKLLSASDIIHTQNKWQIGSEVIDPNKHILSDKCATNT